MHEYTDARVGEEEKQRAVQEDLGHGDPIADEHVHDHGGTFKEEKNQIESDRRDGELDVTRSTVAVDLAGSFESLARAEYRHDHDERGDDHDEERHESGLNQVDDENDVEYADGDEVAVEAAAVFCAREQDRYLEVEEKIDEYDGGDERQLETFLFEPRVLGFTHGEHLVHREEDENPARNGAEAERDVEGQLAGQIVQLGEILVEKHKAEIDGELPQYVTLGDGQRLTVNSY